MDRLKDKVAFITGSSSGIGRAIALSYAKEGAKVVCADLVRTPDERGFEDDKTPTDELIEKMGGESLFVECNIANEESDQKAVEDAVKRFGKIDVVVCNAGIYRFGACVADMPTELLDECWNINLKGNWHLIKAVLNYWLDNGSKGNFVVTCSSSALVPYPAQSAYNISKAAVAMLTRCVALEYGRDGIRANGICPTTVQTALAAVTCRTEKLANGIKSRNPLGRLGVPQDVANLAVFLGSDESSWMNGDLIALDGGETMGNIQMKDMGI